MQKTGTAGRGSEPAAVAPRSWRDAAALGIGLAVLGALAIMLPKQASVAASAGLGAVLAVAGVLTVIQAVRDKGVGGFNWHILGGAAEIVGGILIWLSPMKGAAAIALLVVIVLVVQGGSQVLTALKLRASPGRIGLAVSGVLSLAIAAFIVMRFPTAPSPSRGRWRGSRSSSRAPRTSSSPMAATAPRRGARMRAARLAAVGLLLASRGLRG